ncbi:hydroxymethylbilane synthase [Alicyclobacillus fastidiosus]|uniref:Porphobilinogen deaminase n=1 Tax=Alicyclobacillus fastidiosus TaxID=392011 RepID=A0ABY6ZNT6_9BACL|nr:hydroxymethylbilane synthase [Alicyclobacillus fastidiosus]WAH44238.1 hydroxymethylbilane synthase [Alicyclobacillus fastidiosus]GMA60558.1 porphobilinogen deaminase [Alicyclobacillus fastidiosus]
MRTIRVASRRSQLAMTQTNWVIDELRARRPDWTFEIVPITTKGDKILDVTLSKVGGKGLFVSEIEDVLTAEYADLAVHSLKDVPYELAQGLVLAGIPLRADPRDALISHDGTTLAQLPEGAVVGTSSLRRAAQLQTLRPDLRVEPLRGNIDSRLRRVIDGEFAAIILAAAGLSRMGWQDRITEYLDPDAFIPAVGQGILGVECRASDAELVQELGRWTDPFTADCAVAERTLLTELQGSCQVPIAGYARRNSAGDLTLTGFVANPQGAGSLRFEAAGMEPAALGSIVAQTLLQRGAANYLRAASEG